MGKADHLLPLLSYTENLFSTQDYIAFLAGYLSEFSLKFGPGSLACISLTSTHAE